MVPLACYTSRHCCAFASCLSVCCAGPGRRWRTRQVLHWPDQLHGCRRSHVVQRADLHLRVRRCACRLARQLLGLLMRCTVLLPCCFPAAACPLLHLLCLDCSGTFPALNAPCSCCRRHRHQAVQPGPGSGPACWQPAVAPGWLLVRQAQQHCHRQLHRVLADPGVCLHAPHDCQRLVQLHRVCRRRLLHLRQGLQCVPRQEM